MAFNYNRNPEGEGKHNISWDEAVQIAKREDCRYHYELYQLRNFYIEIKYNRRDPSRKENRTIFSQQQRLQPYLNTIDLSNL